MIPSDCPIFRVSAYLVSVLLPDDAKEVNPPTTTPPSTDADVDCDGDADADAEVITIGETLLLLSVVASIIPSRSVASVSTCLLAAVVYNMRNSMRAGMRNDHIHIMVRM